MSAGIVACSSDCNCRVGACRERGRPVQKHNTRRGRRSGGCRFGGRSSGGDEDRPYSSSPGRRSALTKSLSPFLKGAKPFGKQRPPREEVRRAPFWWSTLGRR